MKRLLAILLTVSLLSGMLVFQTSAATESGTCGDNLTWTANGGTIIISGTGPMYDYSEENPAPWADWNIISVKVVIEEGVTSVGNYAFNNLLYRRIVLPDSIEWIGEAAFRGNVELYFLGDAPEFAQNACAGSYCEFYTVNWPQSKKQNYGGSVTWYDADMRLYIEASEQLFGLNEALKPEDFVFRMHFSDDRETTYYIPREISFGTYDNSTYGQKKVAITVDGRTFEFIYYVTDGTNHLDLIQVHAYPYEELGEACTIPVIVGDLKLTWGEDYTITYTPTSINQLNYDAKITVTGLGIYDGFKKTYSYAILKRDIADAEITVQSAGFLGMPVIPAITVYMNGSKLTEGTDYILVCENDVNVGTGTVRIIGIGNYCGSVTKEFQIGLEATAVSLPGAYNGTATEIVNDNVSYSEGILTPGVFTGRINSSNRHVAYYELYRIDGETPVLITTQQSEYNTSAYTTFTYDFTSVYESAAETGGEVYMLVYSWIDYYNKVYSGVCALYIPAKVSDATAMEIEMVQDTSDYDKAYLDLFGIDGNVENAEWTTSNAAVATVEDGVVSLKSPGTVTITAYYAGATASFVGEVIARSISECAFFGYDVEEEIAYVACDYILMTEGTDYTKSITVDGDVTTVTISGIGLFTGELVRLFNTQTGEPIGETHNFDNSCDGQCNHCEYTRSNDHRAEAGWVRNQTHHWHVCGVCGEKLEIAEHTVNGQDSNLCDVCGTICLTGDADGDGEVTDWDGVMMARYLAGWSVEVELAALDVDGDGEVTDWDGVILDRYLAGWSVTIG